MRITYDTETDSISVPGLDARQTKAPQNELAQALYRNEPVQTAVATIMAAARRLSFD